MASTNGIVLATLEQPPVTEESFTLSHCSFDESRYGEVWRAKIARHVQNLTLAIRVDDDVLESCHHIPSMPRNFRARTRFSIRINAKMENDGQEEMDYYCVDVGHQVICKSYPIAAIQITNAMPRLLHHLQQSAFRDLRRGLQVVSFLSTSIGELLIGLVYDRSIDDADEGQEQEVPCRWSEDATRLQQALTTDSIAHVSKISVMGRSRKRMKCIGCSFVIEKLSMRDGRVLTYKQPEGSFSNPNTHVSRQALDWLGASFQSITASLQGTCNSGSTTLNLLELYCGNGNHTVALAPFFNRVVAVELSEALCLAARENLHLNGITNATIVNTHAHKFSYRVLRTKKWTDPVTQQESLFDCVLVDPPRAGLDAKTLSLVSQYDYIVYISCCPEALARDVKVLQSDSSRFRVLKMATMDQFAYTSHLEMAVVLAKESVAV